MITSISKLKSFGVFKDYKPSKELHPFSKFNLFYGWNGSGKSTLGKLFWSLCQKELHNHFKECEFIVSSAEHADVTHKNVTSNNINIRVFSKDFIDRNVNFDESKANSILILSEEKKDELEKYKTLQSEISTLKSERSTENKVYEKEVADFNKGLSKWASKIKQSFELIETSNKHLLNYDRPKLTKFIQEHKDKINADKILTAEKVAELKHSIKPNKKDNIDLSKFKLIESEKTISEIDEIILSLSKSIFSNQIKRLVDNAEINSWVSTGLAIHKVQESNTCEFCGQTIPEGRIEELNNHFSDDYMNMIELLSSQKEFIQNLIGDLDQEVPETVDYYDEFHKELASSKADLNKNALDFKTILNEIAVFLEEKISNPFSIINYKTDISSKLNSFNDSLNNVVNTSKKHNGKNEGFDEAIKQAQDILELHFVSRTLIDEEFDKLKKNIEQKRESIKLKDDKIIELDTAIKVAETSLLNEAVGAENFNKSLAKFIGRNEIKLEFDKELKGYKLIRGHTTTKAENLSEGERTAIAFVYFISKLKENGNSIENTIIVLDDPISSFDSNHLFHAYSYLKLECETAKQLFILTHNFNYFKLVRDWLIKKNERKKQTDGTYIEKIKSRFYSVECSNEIDRKSTINNANPTLLEYNSEYHYIFYKLTTLADITDIDLEKAFLISNLSRKLLEGFLSFKFPKGRNDFNQLLQAGCKDQEVREKVYRFINKYSHNQVIEFHDASVDNLLGEGSNIVNDVFRIMEDLDKDHFKEMKELIMA